MKEYKIDKTNKLIVKIGEIEESKGDALLCWIAINLKTGPISFYKIHRKAGPQVLSSFILLDEYSKESAAFTSIAGMMNYYTIIHSILPINQNMYNDSFYNIIKTIIKYKETNICRDLTFSFPFPEIKKSMIFDHLFTYSLLLENFTFTLIVEDEKEYNSTISLLDKRLKRNWLSKLFSLSVK
jgi:hypothetical protein